MTALDRPVTRRTAVMVRDGGEARPLVVTLTGAVLVLRLLGRRTAETVDLKSAYFGAIKARAFHDKMAKAKARKAGRRTT